MSGAAARDELASFLGDLESSAVNFGSGGAQCVQCGMLVPIASFTSFASVFARLGGIFPLAPLWRAGAVAAAARPPVTAATDHERRKEGAEPHPIGGG